MQAVEQAREGWGIVQAVEEAREGWATVQAVDAYRPCMHGWPCMHGRSNAQQRQALGWSIAFECA